MTSRVLVATDLDRTLIYSRAALGTGPRDGDPLVVVEHRDGRPLSFMTRRAADSLAALAGRHLVVPVTTRTRAQLARVELPGPPPRYAVAANGGVLLAGGEVDGDWAAAVRAAVAAAAPLAEARAVLKRICAGEWAGQPRDVEGLFCCAVVDRVALPDDVVPALRAWAGPAGWSVSLQGRKLYLVPAALTKSAAVREVARRAGTGVVLAAGDSLLDVDLLRAADRAVRPGHGEIAESGWTAPWVHALTAIGGRAGEEIVAWLAREADLHVRASGNHRAGRPRGAPGPAVTSGACTRKGTGPAPAHRRRTS